MVDAGDSKSPAFGRAGSSPALGTNRSANDLHSHPQTTRAAPLRGCSVPPCNLAFCVARLSLHRSALTEHVDVPAIVAEKVTCAPETLETTEVSADL